MARFGARAKSPATATTGAIGTGATTNDYYDGRGDVVSTESPSGLWTTAAYDGADRLTDTATGDLKPTNGAAGLLQNESFEDGLTNGTYQLDPSGTPWTFAGDSGVSSQISYVGPPPIQHGSDTAFVKAGGSISQAVSLGAGTYTVTFDAAKWAGSADQSLDVVVDGVTVGTVTPTNDGTFGSYTVQFTVSTSGTHTVAFAFPGSGGGYVYVDDAVLTAGADVTESQTHYQYDGDGNVVETTTADRLSTDADTAIGALDDGRAANAGGPAARVSYTADYYDAADRLTGTLDLGTNGGQPPSALPTEPGAYTEPPTLAIHLVPPPPGSLWTSYAYDPAGNVSAVTDPRGVVTAYTYDALGRTTETVADYTGSFSGIPIGWQPSTDSTPTGSTPTDSSNQTTAWTYDGDNNVTSMTAVLPTGEANQTTDYVYGVSPATGSGIYDNDLLYQTQYPDPTTGAASAAQAETYGYDALGDQTTYTDRNGTTHAYSYDQLGRLTSDKVVVFAMGVDQTVDKLGYTYTDAGELATATSYDQFGNVLNQTSDTYDGFGQLASEAQAVSGAVTGSTPTVGYTYDATKGDRQTGITYPNGRTVSYNYAAGVDDDISRLSSISDASGLIRSYNYLGLNAALQQTDGNGVTLTTTLDSLGRVASMTYANSAGTTIDGFGYTYDADGNVLSRRNAVLSDDSELYTYDGLNRLIAFARGTLNSDGTAIVGTPTGTESWNYDAVGNWKSVTTNGVTTSRTNTAQNQIGTVSTPATGGGNTTATLGYDANGNTLVGDNGQQYVYDAWNRLVTVKNAAGTTIAGYTYDAQGRRVTETHGSVTTALHYDDNENVIEERVGGVATTQYVWDGTDRLVERDDHDPATSGTALNRRLYAQQDADGNVTSLTDASGTVVERYVYGPYGVVTVLNPDGTVRGDGTASGSNYNWRVLHQGLRYDPATGTYNNLRREYDPGLGRFLQQDPAGYVDGASRYQYELASPCLLTDNSGLSASNWDWTDDLENDLIYKGEVWAYKKFWLNPSHIHRYTREEYEYSVNGGHYPAGPAARPHTTNHGEVVTAALGDPPPNLAPLGADRQQAFDQARKDYGIPLDQKPDDVTWEADHGGKGMVPTYQYLTTDKDGNPTIVHIREDGFGHEYPDDPSQDRGSHFNIGTDPNNLDDHYDYQPPPGNPINPIDIPDVPGE